MLQGLLDSRKELPSKYFYDEVGSQLFEQICELDEYYLTRTELSIMQEHMHEIASLLGPNSLLIEYGSGSSTKVVLPVCADYTSDFELPLPGKPVLRRVAYFPGSTIGNFDREPAKQFLKQIARVCQSGGLLIGVDLKKDFNILHRAYNDSQGVTAQFNKHLLVRINQELDANFQLNQFGHYAFYNPGQSRIEMHLVSLKNQAVRIGDIEIAFKLGESIWTESSNQSGGRLPHAPNKTLST